MGLKESKEYVEKFRQTSWDNGTLPKTYATRYPGAVAPAPKPTLGWDYEFKTDDEPPF